MTLTPHDIDTFVTDGFVAVRGAVNRSTADACRAQLWDLIPARPDDPSTWTEPVHRVASPWTPEFARAASAPDLLSAFDTLVGPGRWQPRVELGNVVIRLPVDTDTGDTGWHFDGSFTVPGDAWPHVTVSSRDRGLLMLFLLSDVGDDDAPTRIKVGSHLDVPRYLAPHGDTGVSMFAVCQAMDADGTLDSPDRPEVLATGRAGDVFLCHPFLVHAAQAHRGSEPRFMAQPGLMLSEQLDLSDPRSPVERAIAHAAG